EASYALWEDFDMSTNLWSAWSVENPNADIVKWDTITQIVAPGNTQTAIFVNLRSSTNRNGQLDYLYSPPVNVATTTARSLPIRLSFDLAYNNRNTIFKDSLFIEIATGCETEWRRIFTSGGDSLKTYTANIPTQISQWRHYEFMDSVVVPTNDPDPL